MRTAIMVSALVAVVCAVVAAALAGGALASSGHTGEGFGIMNNHNGAGAMNGHDMGHKNGACASCSNQEHQVTCSINADGTAASGFSCRSADRCSTACSGQSCAPITEMGQIHIRGCH